MTLEFIVTDSKRGRVKFSLSIVRGRENITTTVMLLGWREVVEAARIMGMTDILAVEWIAPNAAVHCEGASVPSPGDRPHPHAL